MPTGGLMKGTAEDGVGANGEVTTGTAIGPVGIPAMNIGRCWTPAGPYVNPVFIIPQGPCGQPYGPGIAIIGGQGEGAMAGADPSRP